MATLRFIDAQFIKDNSIINDNVDVKYINTAIDLAMDMDLRQLIGTAFYDALKASGLAAAGVINNITPTAYKTLVQRDEFRNFLMWNTVARATIYMTYKYQNKSVAKKSSDNAQPVENYDIDKLTDEAKNNAQFYGERLLYFIRDNEDDYELITECGDIDAPVTAYHSPVYTGDRRPNGRRGNPNTR